MSDQELEVDVTQLKLPPLIPQESNRDHIKDGYEEVEIPKGSEDGSKVETLPDIYFGGKKNAKVVTFKDDEKSEDREVDVTVLRLPNIHQPRSNTGLQARERIRENLQTNINEFSSSGIRGNTENHFDVKDNNESFPRMLKNYEFQRDLRYTHCSQKLSRVRYSYFPRFPSPKPMNKKEKMKMELEENTLKKREEGIHPGSLRTKDEYSKIFISLRNVEKKFVKKHHLSCRPLADSPFFMD